MKCSEKWLLADLPFTLTTEKLIHQLTMLGLEVDSCLAANEGFSKVYAGLIENIVPHPNAEKLQICKVRVKPEEEPLTIICGGTNLFIGAKVAVAVHGAKLAQFKIKKSKIRGEYSYGMICSASELGILPEHKIIDKHIWLLPANVPLGVDIWEYLHLNDQIIDISITPNRGDCLSILGLRRELCAINGFVYQEQPINEVKLSNIQHADPNIDIDAKECCSIYHGRIVRNIDKNIATPLCIQEKLRRSGIGSNGLSVDITNYVMLELGAPMHAFDLGKLQGNIVVRKALAHEKLELLNNNIINLTTDCLVIADDKQPLALAGVMGGINSAISKDTTDILLECACFDADYVRTITNKLNIHSDSSYRFARGVDPQITIKAIKRASELLLQICGDKIEFSEIYTQKVSNTQMGTIIELPYQSVTRLLGISIDNGKILTILRNLNCIIKKHDEQGCVVQVPSFRYDLTITADLIEEIARVFGYDNIVNCSAQRDFLPNSQQDEHYYSNNWFNLCKNLRNSFVNNGYHEVISYSFISSEMAAVLAEKDTIALTNPISANMNIMRSSLLPSLIQCVAKNNAHQKRSFKIFEIAKTYSLTATKKVTEIYKLSGALFGEKGFNSWAESSEKYDFFDAKGDILRLFPAALRQKLDFAYLEKNDHVYNIFHPQKSAKISLNNNIVGFIGVLHPLLQQKMKLAEIILFELNLESFSQDKIYSYNKISKYPEVSRDLSLVMPCDLSVQKIIDVVKNCTQYLKEIFVIDVFTDESLQREQQQSIAIRCIFQRLEQTLLDDDVNVEVNTILQLLQTKYSVILREN